MEENDVIKENETEKPVRLSLHLICKRNLSAESQTLHQEKIIEALNKITHLRLDRERIKEIDSLELLGDRCSNLYLQHNLIESIENLECLKNLTFISLAGNRIRKIENLRHLNKLLFLDLSDNQISDVDKDEIPSSVIILNLQGNPCTSYPEYKYKMIADLPNLRQLDLCEITTSDKQAAGLDVSSDEDGDDDDDDDERRPTIHPTDNGHKNSESFQTLAAGIMLRSQKRTEDSFREHQRHTSQLDDLRISWNVPPSSRSSARSSLVQDGGF